MQKKRKVMVPYVSARPMSRNVSMHGVISSDTIEGNFGRMGCVSPQRLSGFGAAATGGANSPYLVNYSYSNPGGLKIGVATSPAVSAPVAAHVVAVPVTSTAGKTLAQLVAARGLHGFGRLRGFGASDASATLSAARAGSAAAGAATALGVAAATAGVGLVIGAVVGEALQLLKAREGKAAKTWDELAPQVRAGLPGSQMTEITFAEGLKGMMDKGNNIIPGCGTDGHKNPDCFAQPLANAVVQGYVSGKVPLSATSAQVYNQVIVPWMQGGGGTVRWQVLQSEPSQQAMIAAMVDRYLNGMPITRADMVEPVYKNDPGYNAFHTPALVDALVAAGVLQTAAPSVSTPAAPIAAAASIPSIAPAPVTVAAVAADPSLLVAASPAAVAVAPAAVPVVAASLTPVPTLGTTSAGTPVVAPDNTAALMQQLMAQGQSQQQALTAAIASLQAQGVNTSTPAVQQQLSSDLSQAASPTPIPIATAGTSLPTSWLAIGAALFALSFAFARPAKSTSGSK